MRGILAYNKAILRALGSGSTLGSVEAGEELAANCPTVVWASRTPIAWGVVYTLALSCTKFDHSSALNEIRHS